MTIEISLMEVYLIETLRKNNVTDETIIEKVRAKQVSHFQQYNDKFDFEWLYELEQRGVLEEVLEKGYQIKYLTFNGLVNLLRLKFNKEEKRDYIVENFSVKELVLPVEDKGALKRMLSNNWCLAENEGKISIQPISSVYSSEGGN